MQIRTLAELKRVAAKWDRTNYYVLARDPDFAARLEQKVTAAWNACVEYIGHSPTGTDDPAAPHLGRPWSGVVRAAYTDVTEAIRRYSAHKRYAADYEAVKAKLG